jgi:hypothetical protein
MALCIYFKPDFTYSHKTILSLLTQVEPGYYALIFQDKVKKEPTFDLWFNFTKRTVSVMRSEASHVMSTQSSIDYNSLPNEIKAFFLLGGLDAIINAS